MGGSQGLRVMAAALALASAGLHLVLFLWDLIPGQPTAGAAPFLAMAVLYTGVAAVAWLELRRLYFWAAAYTAATIAGYFVTRLGLGFPVEVWGLTTKAVDIALLAGLLALWRQGSEPAPTRQAS
jgi:hypothetical protein